MAPAESIATATTPITIPAPHNQRRFKMADNPVTAIATAKIVAARANTRCSDEYFRTASSSAMASAFSAAASASRAAVSSSASASGVTPSAICISYLERRTSAEIRSASLTDQEVMFV